MYALSTFLMVTTRGISSISAAECSFLDIRDWIPPWQLVPKKLDLDVDVWYFAYRNFVVHETMPHYLLVFPVGYCLCMFM